MTWTESGWLMSVVPHQPHFPGMPADTFTLWGYGLLIDSDGDYVTLEQTGPPPGYRIGISAGQGYRTSSPVTARPSSIRWISDAPSKIVKILASRCQLPAQQANFL
jgi:hypothetical protein